MISLIFTKMFRLVEVQQVPWNAEDLSRVLQHGTLRDSANKIAREEPYLLYMLQRMLCCIIDNLSMTLTSVAELQYFMRLRLKLREGKVTVFRIIYVDTGTLLKIQ
jgi:hypothetical protein